MANITPLQAAVDALAIEAEKIKTVKDSVVAYVTGILGQTQAAVEAALRADNAADDASIVAVAKEFDKVRASVAATTADLGAIVVANTPSA